MNKSISLLLTIGLTVLLWTWPGVALGDKPSPPMGVDHLRGRWDGTLQGFQSADQSFRLLLQEFIPDPGDPDAAIAGGCMSVGKRGTLAPLLARAVSRANGEFDLTLYGTALTQDGALVIRLSGLAETHGAGVRDDAASGEWRTAGEGGTWSASHHDRRRPKCPKIQLGYDLRFHADVYALAHVEPDGSQNQGTILESYTNIVSAAVLVELPDGSTLQLPSGTDLFSPHVDFVEEFRYISDQDGFPVPGGPYAFTLLDPYGAAISGATTADTWLACTVDPPVNVSANIEGDGIRVAWDPVPQAPGFDPGGADPLGFYQLELSPEDGEGGEYGASDVRLSEHLVPLAGFGGFAEGAPDGWDFGQALEELPDGNYGIDVITFAEAPPGSEASELECQIRAGDERTRLKKDGGVITIQD